MDRYVVLVDAGYFFAAGSEAAFSAPVPRRHLALKSPDEMLRGLRGQASEMVGGIDMLRVYWYDAMPGPRLSLEQSTLAMMAGVKLRLGALNGAGEQKGVDSLIVTDLIELARNRAVSDAVLVSGDEDLRIALQIAQSFGVRVHLLAIGDPTRNVSPSLQMEADSVATLEGTWFEAHLLRDAPTPPSALVQPATSPSPSGNEDFAAAAESVVVELLGATDKVQLIQLKHHFAQANSVPPEFDRPLIARVGARLGRMLTGEEKRNLRGVFVRHIRDSGSD